MNAKKTKNKQKHKPPTPQPKQEVSDAVEVNPEETQAEVQVETEVVKSDERVPGIVSENVQPAIEAKLLESDAPKKPKRNRNKKKKGDKTGETENISDDHIFDESKNVCESKETKDDNTTEITTTITPEVTPVARKKKNKNKKRSDQSEKEANQNVQISPIAKGEELTDLKIITVVPVSTETSEESKSKKKNKKKKRHDSERSEKAEEILLCTSAFQKLLEPRDDKKDIKKDVKSEIAQDSTIQKDLHSLSVKTATESLKPHSPVRDLSSENKTDLKEVGGKAKKKNKKDKKHPPKDESDDEVVKPLQTKIEIDSEGQSVTVPSDIKCSTENIYSKATESIPKDVQKPVEEKTLIEQEKSPKPKAKIAKPVEKKRKEKQDVSSTENLTGKEHDSILSLEDNKQKTVSETTKTSVNMAVIPPIELEKAIPIEQQQVMKPVELSSKNVEEIKQIETVISEATESIPKPASTETLCEKKSETEPTKPIDVSLQNVEEIKGETNVPEPIESKVNIAFTDSLCEKSSEISKIHVPESSTSKKRKKSPKPKPSKTIETFDQKTAAPPQHSVHIDENISILPEATKQEDPATKPESQNQNIETLKLNEPIPLSLDLLPSQEVTQIHVLETPDIKTEASVKDLKASMQDVPTKIPADKECILVPEAHMGKKRKKSPKPQKKFENQTRNTQSAVTDTFKTSSETFKSCELKTDETLAPVGVTKETLPQQPMTDSLADLPTLEDIEIRSVKADEPEGSTCDFTPEIQCPRATSQSFDNNNNASIQDVTSADVKLNDPYIVPDTPVIQGSVETSSPAAKQAHSGVTITEMYTSKEEKSSKPCEKVGEKTTDLKSKVLDVNIGMEELRRSIERSLAELSSMEKSEKEAEEQFFKAQAKLEHISQMATKKSEEKKQENIEVLPIPEVFEVVPKDEIKDTKLQTDELNPCSKSDEVVSQPIHLMASPPSPLIEEKKPDSHTSPEASITQTPPVPARKDNKGKNKKKKGKQDSEISAVPVTTTSQGSSIISSTTTPASSHTKESVQDTKKEEKSEPKTDKNTSEKGKQQSSTFEGDSTDKDNKKDSMTDSSPMGFEPIESFEDALYASVDENEQDVNKTFEIIADEATKCDESLNPEINITAPIDDEDNTVNDQRKHEKENPVTQPKNLLGHPNIPARLNKTDYKKEKNKHQTPNTKHATVKIKDTVPVEVTKESKESQTENKRRFLKDKTVTESITSITGENEDYIYKYSFRKVFLPNACHICKKDLKAIRVPCNFCNLIFYCSLKHKDEDYSQHQGFCFAVSTIVHMRNQKHIYADAKNITGHEYRLLRMQMIVSCEKVLKRRLVPWEQEALLYPRICADASCREWRHNKLKDCEGCGQISYCSDDPTHLPRSHQRWCKSYSLYNKLVVYQQTKGRLEPSLPTRVMPEFYQIPEKLNEVLAAMYEEKIEMTDIQYAALTQIATAPLTAAYCYQLYNNKMNTIYANGAIKKSSFTIHVVGAELQFEADALNKWEVFFLHHRPDVKDLSVVLVGPELNPSKLPLDLLAKIKLCENCRQNKRRVLFDFQDKKTYNEYWSTDFCTPDLVCAFNPSIQRSSVFNGKDTWPSTIKCIIKLKVPFIITSYTMSELQNDLTRIKECSEVDVHTISEVEYNPFASVRPDRNFISDDEMPLLFKNYCFATVCGAI